jgi:hypothetical protein
MSSIRRILSGISSAATWAARLEVTAPIRHKPLDPVEPVRRGFSDHSDFQSSQEAERSLLESHAPNLSGRPRRSSDPMSAYTGHSDFQARLPRYQYLLGTNIPPPPARYWEAWRSRSAPTASQEAQARQDSDSRSRPGLSATADLEKSFELAGEADSVLLYAPKEGEGGRSVIQHPDGTVTDPEAPENRFADAQAWESTHPDLKRALALSRDDVELVLAMPEGEARNEVLSELANPDTLEASSTESAPSDDFMPSLEDLPVETDSTPEPSVAADAFMPSLEDLPSSGEPVAELLAATEDSVPLAPEELEAQLSPAGELAEGRSPLEVGEQVARRGTPEQQAQVATALYEKSQAPDVPEAPAYTRGAALAASGSPQAAQALLQRIGQGNLGDFVRSVMQA